MSRLLEVAIIGEGPGGMLAAWQLNQLTDRQQMRITVYDSGKASTDRVCPRKSTSCDCQPSCHILEGKGGAGGWSDGKITLTAKRGVHQDSTVLGEYQTYALEQLDRLLTEYGVEGTWHSPLESPPDVVRPLLERGWKYETYPLRHMGSDGLQVWVGNFCEHLRNNGIFQSGDRVLDILTENGRVTGIKTEHEHIVTKEKTVASKPVDYLIVASGLAGSAWLERWAEDNGFPLSTGPADIGLRLETESESLAPLIDEFYDVKLTHRAPNGLEYRSFCVNGQGFITNENHKGLGIRGVNGFSLLWEKTGWSNMAILAKVTRDWCPVSDPKRYVLDVARSVNARVGGATMVQRLGDFLRLPGYLSPEFAFEGANAMQPSNIKAVWGDLASALPESLYEGYVSFIRGIAVSAPGVLNPDNVVYGPEIKYYAHPFDVDRHWRSRDVGNLFIIGNASGRTASLSAAALAGMMAGREVAEQASVEHGTTRYTY